MVIVIACYMFAIQPPPYFAICQENVHDLYSANMLIKYGHVCCECLLGCLYIHAMGRAIGLRTHFDPRFICAVNMMSILCHKISQRKGD